MAVRMVRSLISIWFWICKHKWRFLIPLVVAAYLMVGGATASYIVSRKGCDLHQEKYNRNFCEISSRPGQVTGIIAWPLYWPIHAGYNIFK